MGDENLKKESKTGILFWLWTKGRAGRKTWWLAFALSLAAFSLWYFKSEILNFSEKTFSSFWITETFRWIISLMIFMGIYFYLMTSVKRVHDLNLSFDEALGYCGYSFIVDCLGDADSGNPILNVIMRIIACLIALLFLWTVAIVILGVKKGTCGSNKFGDETLNLI